MTASVLLPAVYHSIYRKQLIFVCHKCEFAKATITQVSCASIRRGFLYGPQYRRRQAWLPRPPDARGPGCYGRSAQPPAASPYGSASTGIAAAVSSAGHNTTRLTSLWSPARRQPQSELAGIAFEAA